MALLPGQFLIASIGLLGEGGLGVVDLVRVTDSNQAHPIGTQLARKRLNARWALEPQAQERFEREIQLLRTMSHPNIVALEGESLPGGERSYFMPHYPATLRSQLNDRVVHSLSQVAALGHAVAHALDYAHDLGFTHRDIKPDNILLTYDGTPVLSDWGLGQFIHQHSKVLNLTRGGPMGTEYYCSLEQWATGKGGIPGDVYSLGMTLAEVATGRPVAIPAIGLGIQVDVVSPHLPGARQFNAIVRKMTSVTPTHRHATMVDVARELHGLLR
jgi:serine/threonine protein kinase